MSTSISANPGFSYLTQLLTNSGSAAATSALSALSTPSVESALQKAPSGDVVQLSQQALQLQEAVGLFSGASSLLPTATTPANLLTQAVDSSVTGSTTAGAASPTAAASTTPLSVLG